jgi:hypothetical protein
MGKKATGNKRKAIEVDQEKALENQGFIAMRTVANSWPALSTKEE